MAIRLPRGRHDRGHLKRSYLEEVVYSSGSPCRRLTMGTQALPVEADIAGETAAALTHASSTDAEPGDAPAVAEVAEAVPATNRGDDTGDDTGGDPAGVELTADDPDRILHVDPAELVIGANVRVDPRLDKEFLASIKAVHAGYQVFPLAEATPATGIGTGAGVDGARWSCKSACRN